VIPIDPSYLRAAANLCRERGVLFAVDEVQTGIGRTGRWFGYQHADLVPDMVCLAKGLGGGFPIGAVAFRRDRIQVKTGSHGSTFGGNPLACAAALAVLSTIESEQLVQQAATNGARLKALLEDRLAGNERIRSIRGQGLMIGIAPKASSVPIQRALQERGLLTLGAGPRVLLPPLITPWFELERLAQAIVEEIQR
ncbi:MAG: aminotransferase class III-fold pyridoxal phosphate-dependent enzyme, partial [bacterium]|nr:aminotransferase class III-fold pyridoxal phosphate-dependent enzyme [bacterium]